MLRATGITRPPARRVSAAKLLTGLPVVPAGTGVLEALLEEHAGDREILDSSALLPLLVAEPAGEQLRQLMAEDPRLLVWWSSRVEITSALARRERERALSARDMNAAMSGVLRKPGRHMGRDTPR